jgi:hypothetical protein
MKECLPNVFLTIILFASCAHPPDLSEQVKSDFLARLKKIDSSLVLDSFKIIRTQPMVQKIERMIDVETYQKLISSVRLQLANATREHKEDSIGFYQEEIDYMVPLVDSVSSSVSKADTSKKFGLLLICFYQIKRNNASAKGNANYFFNDKMKLIFPDAIDSSIYHTSRVLKP